MRHGARNDALNVLMVFSAAVVLSVCVAAEAAESSRVLYDFEYGAQGWMRRMPDGAETQLRIAKDFTPGASRALEIPVEFPGETQVSIRERGNWFPFTTLSLDIFLPADAVGRIEAIVYVRDTDLWWYQTLLRPPLKPGRFNHFEIDLYDTSVAWEPKGHFRPWDGYVRQDITELGVKIIGDATYKGNVYLDNLRLADPLETRAPKTPTIHNFRCNASGLKVYDRFELSFSLSKSYENPFDPAVIDIEAHFTTPSGKVVSVPAFLYQAYMRRNVHNVERLIPVGRRRWVIRFTPQEPGTYKYFLEIFDGTSTRTKPRTFQVAPSKARGFVRISKRDKRYFEFDNGEFYYPIGHNVCAPYDERNAANFGITVLKGEGTFAYDRFLSRMAANDENLARVWFVPWAFEIEWSHRYDYHYKNLGRYNLENAWRLDYVLQKAERLGIHVMITLDTHGRFGVKTDSDWQTSPYNIRNGGFLTEPSGFFTHPRARRLYEQRIRYIMARWGYSTAVFSWEILNEIDLVEYYPQSYTSIIYWHRQAAEWIRSLDQGRHILTSNVYWWLGRPIGRNQRLPVDPFWNMACVEYTSAHLFDKRLIETFAGALGRMDDYNKIFLVTECGDEVFGGEPQTTANYIHTALWSSHVMPFAAAAMPWWWSFIDDRNLYPQFKALAAFAKGEDRRNRDFDYANVFVIDGTSGARSLRLHAMGIRDATSAYLWVFDPPALSYPGGKGLRPGKPVLVIRDFENGKYRVEFWDTQRGVVTKTLETTVDKGELRVPLPKFEKDIACKIKARK